MIGSKLSLWQLVEGEGGPYRFMIVETFDTSEGRRTRICGSSKLEQDARERMEKLQKNIDGETPD